MKTSIELDISQMEVINDIAKCNRCGTKFQTKIVPDLKSKIVKCSCCDHIQAHQVSRTKILKNYLYNAKRKSKPKQK
jgi:hypothetical protein